MIQIVESPGYARFECPDGTSTFSVHQAPEAPGGSQVVVYFECEDLDATVKRLQQEGIELESGPAEQPWLWREAYVRDPAGNVVCLYHAGENRRNPPWRIVEP